MNNLTVETEDTFASLLELAANNDVEGFKRSIERDISGIDEVGLWYGRKKGSKHMVLDHRTPLMVAAIYGSTDVVKLILSVSNSDVNRSCGLDKCTALHCAASGGSINALDVVKVLLEAGADPNLVDANGHCPFDVIVVSPKFQDLKFSLEKFLATNGSNSNSNSPPLSPSPENRSLSSGSDSTSSPQSPNHEPITGLTVLASHSTHVPIRPQHFIKTWDGPNRMSRHCIYLEAIFSLQKQLLNELSRLSLNRSTHSKTLTTPSNLEDLFSSESSSPRYSPTPKSAYLNQFQQQKIIASQSPMNANFSPKTMDQPLMQASFGVPSMSPRGVDPISPMGSRVSMLSQHQQQQFRSLSSRDLGSNSSAIGGNPSWAKWGSSNGKPDWSVNADEFGKIRRSLSFEFGNNGEEPDLSWVQSLVKESPEEMKEKPETGTLAGVGSSGEGSDLHSSQIESIDQSVLSAWLEQKQLDQLMAQ
ncbi:CCCH-type zinc finger protein with ARM repeat domain-containing protein [Actinidia rufa]|uniref:CCCH-type zinc finger protein with ARM repeat domain-containing protein n=1 Tax=Actinidia rufa TaxID=165716 RepID=A0A7J0FCS2_9ERIC|nr:CCCH-type zinc finger protein with ARM repeat domain-containing protein [Actinidia rufa]